MSEEKKQSFDENLEDDPRTVSRGPKIQTGFLGIDSLYLVIEYPYLDIFEFWSRAIDDLRDKRLWDGIPFEGLVIRHGGLGYKLSVWDGDARLFITDRVEETLQDTSMTNQGMGMMLQLGPKWLRQNGDLASIEDYITNIYRQLQIFGMQNPQDYPARLNRLDIAIDILNLPIWLFSIDEWRQNWVGYAKKKTFYDSEFGLLEGFSIGSSQGSVRFKVYDKAMESRKKQTSGFWISVWNIDTFDLFSVSRFEWSVKCYSARFTNMQYLSDLTYQGFLDVLNYVTLRWGRLCIPNSEDLNRSRWELAPLWKLLRQLIDDWSGNYSRLAKREYNFTPDINDHYLRSLAGWLSGLQARVGINRDIGQAASFFESIGYLEEHNYRLSDIQRTANQKYKIQSRLSGKPDGGSSL